MSDRQGKKLQFSGWTEFSTVLMELTTDQQSKNPETKEEYQ